MEEEVQTIKKDIAEIKEAVKDVSTVVNDMRVLLAGNYIQNRILRITKKERKTADVGGRVLLLPWREHLLLL